MQPEQGQSELEFVQKLINTLIEFFVNYSFQVLGAIIILIVGGMIAGWVSRLLIKAFEKKKMDVTLSNFLATCVKMLILVFAGIIALGKFGITITPFIAALSAVAFGASMAIQGPLSNYGAGVGIILGRPFVVGNTITVAGVTGTVEEVKLANTTLRNGDGVQITIPNKDIVGQILHNSKDRKVINESIGVSYESSPEKAIQIIRAAIESSPKVSKTNKPQIGIESFGDSTINIEYRYWAPAGEYYQTMYDMNLEIYKALVAGGVTIPYPRRDVRIISQPAAEAVSK